MDYQGARRTRPAHARQAPWPPADDPGDPAQEAEPEALTGSGTGGYRVLEAGSDTVSGPEQVLGAISGAQRALGPGSSTVTGPQRVLGDGSGTVSGPQTVFGAVSGSQPTMERTAARGFPPLAPGRQQAPTPPEGFGAWDAPGAQPGGPAGQPGGPAEGGAGAGFEPDEDDDPVSPASMTPGAGRRGARSTGSAASRRRSSRVAWLALAAVLIVAAGGYAGYKYLYEPRVNAPVPSSLRLPTDSPASSGFDQALGKWQHIGTRAQDPQPLTLDALFPLQFELNGSSYQRTAAGVSKNCTLAVFGANLQAALQAGHCTQVLRASYISGNGTMMGTVGVANLTSSSAAQKAGQATGPQEIIAPLAAQKGPTSKLGHGTGVVQAEIKGHYLILMWAEFTSLKSPSTPAQRQQLEQFAANLVTGSANINLSSRMLTGKP
jgi:hypothetical protein